MATKVLVPLLGEGVEEVTVIKWLKKEGDSVKELEPLLEVNTDKVDTEIPAPASGTVLKIMAEEGVPAKVGAVLAFIGKAGESVDVSSGQVSSATASKVESKVEGQKSVQTSTTLDVRPSTELGFISPVVAKIAAEHGVYGDAGDAEFIGEAGDGSELIQVVAHGDEGEIEGGDAASVAEFQELLEPLAHARERAELVDLAELRLIHGVQ